MKRTLLILFLLSTSAILSADTYDENGYSVNHPSHEYINDSKPGGPGYTVVPTAPPDGPRMCAEWEPATGVVIRYPLGLPWTMIETAAQEIEIICVVSSSNLSAAQADFSAHAVADVTFVVADNNTYWSRDWGPWGVFDESGAYGISDHVYNRADTSNREEDDQVDWTLASLFSVNLWKTELRHTGGNFMTDGHGTGMSGDDIYDYDFNTDISADSVNALMEAYWGIDNYVTFPDPLASYIDHIDCYAKFLNEETIVMVRNGDDDTALDALEVYIEGLDNCYGGKYNVYRVDAPSVHNAAYANSIILNNRVFVPITGYADEDSAAIALYEELMPGYEIIGILNPGGTIEFLPTDAIHCRTMAFYDSNMLYIDHAPLQDQSSLVDSYKVDAQIISYAGNALLGDSLRIYYRSNMTKDSLWSFTMMHNDSSQWYSGKIPPQADMSIVDYYITATDNAMKRACDPYPAPAGYFTFNVDNSAAMIHYEEFELNDDAGYNGVRVSYNAGYILIESDKAEYMNAVVFDAAGRNTGCRAISFDNKIWIDHSNLKHGIYFLKYGINPAYSVEKFLIVK